MGNKSLANKEKERVTEEMETRVAKLEVQLEIHTRDLAKLETKIDHRLDIIQKDLKSIVEAQTKQKGFWAGVTFFASILGFLIAQTWGHVKNSVS